MAAPAQGAGKVARWLGLPCTRHVRPSWRHGPAGSAAPGSSTGDAHGSTAGAPAEPAAPPVDDDPAAPAADRPAAPPSSMGGSTAGAPPVDDDPALPSSGRPAAPSSTAAEARARAELATSAQLQSNADRATETNANIQVVSLGMMGSTVAGGVSSSDLESLAEFWIFQAAPQVQLGGAHALRRIGGRFVGVRAGRLKVTECEQQSVKSIVRAPLRVSCCNVALARPGWCCLVSYPSFCEKGGTGRRSGEPQE